MSYQWETYSKKGVRPDIAIVGKNIYALELTVCHETNLIKSREYKKERYKNISILGSTLAGNRVITAHFIEITTLGFISDCSSFSNVLKIPLSRCRLGIESLNVLLTTHSWFIVIRTATLFLFHNLILMTFSSLVLDYIGNWRATLRLPPLFPLIHAILTYSM